MFSFMQLPSTLYISAPQDTRDNTFTAFGAGVSTAPGHSEPAEVAFVEVVVGDIRIRSVSP